MSSGFDLITNGGMPPFKIALVKGSPGSGKTTLVLQLLNESDAEKICFFTKEQTEDELKEACEPFGYDIGGKIQVCTVKNDDQNILNKAADYDAVAFDSLNALENILLPGNGLSDRQAVNSLFSDLRNGGKRVYFIYENTGARHSIPEYEADILLELSCRGANRFIEIKKMRNRGYVGGRHPFEILGSEQIKKRYKDLGPEQGIIEMTGVKPGITVFPNARAYARQFGQQTRSSEFEPKPTGIEGLDQLLPIDDSGSGFAKGDNILVIGGPGTGKTIFGLHFAMQPLTEHERVLWLSFEGAKEELYRSVKNFNPRLFNIKEKNFMFHYAPPATADPYETMSLIKNIVQSENPVPARLVIDSITELKPWFAEAAEFKNYIATLLSILAEHNVTTVFLYRREAFFGGENLIQTELASLVDLIICLKEFDVKNRIRKGVFVLKARGRKHNSDILSMDFDNERGMQVSSKGWEHENLLSGMPGEIREPELFLKLFYENPAEKEINDGLIDDFKERYPNHGLFSCVRKEQISSEFWSFRGDFGAGHSNIRIISVSDHVIEAFRDRGRLLNLDDFFSSDFLSGIKQDRRWMKYRNSKGNYDFIPVYTEFGFLVLNVGYLDQLIEENKNDSQKVALLTEVKKNAKLRKNQDDQGFDLNDVSWDELLSVGKALIDGLKRDKENGPFLFTLPPLNEPSEFVAFFVELLWTHGGDIYKLPPFYPEKARNVRLDKTRTIMTQLEYFKFLVVHNKTIQDLATGYVVDILNKIGERRPSITLAIKEASDLMGPDKCDQTSRALRKLVEDRESEELENKLPLDLRVNLSDLADVIQFLHKVKTDKTRPAILPGTILDKDILFTEVTISEKEAIQAVKFMYDLVYSGLAPTPETGDHFGNALFARKWYSSLSGYEREEGEMQANKGNNEDDKKPEIRIFNLPYREDADGKKQSFTSLRVWCMGIIRDALSPEVGWIFIDAMNSVDWVRERMKSRSGLPHRLDDYMVEIKRDDPKTHAAVERIVEGNRKRQAVNRAKEDIVSVDMVDSEVKEAWARLLKGNFEVQDIAEVAQALEAQPEREALHILALDEAIRVCGYSGRAITSLNKDSMWTAISALFLEKTARTTYGSGQRLGRPFYHRFENIIHSNLKRLFVNQERQILKDRLVQIAGRVMVPNDGSLVSADGGIGPAAAAGPLWLDEKEVQVINERAEVDVSTFFQNGDILNAAIKMVLNTIKNQMCLEIFNSISHSGHP